jgi:acetyl esterase/lipase
LPVVVYAHGGGFVSGELDTDHGDCVELARMAGCLVVSVDYRLAPESRCPAALDDVSAAFDFAIANADKLNADPSRVALAGRDAGAGLVAGLAQSVFDAEGPRIRLQILHEPMLNQGSTRSRREFQSTPGLSGRAMDRGWAHYLADTPFWGTPFLPPGPTSRGWRRHSSAAQRSVPAEMKHWSTPTG